METIYSFYCVTAFVYKVTKGKLSQDMTRHHAVSEDIICYHMVHKEHTESRGIACITWLLTVSQGKVQTIATHPSLLTFSYGYQIQYNLYNLNQLKLRTFNEFSSGNKAFLKKITTTTTKIRQFCFAVFFLDKSVPDYIVTVQIKIKLLGCKSRLCLKTRR